MIFFTPVDDVSFCWTKLSSDHDFCYMLSIVEIWHSLYFNGCRNG